MIEAGKTHARLERPSLMRDDTGCRGQHAFPSVPDTVPIEVVSAGPHWVEMVVPCALKAVEYIHRLHLWFIADLPEEIRESVGDAFRELLFNAVEWGGKLDPARNVRVAFIRGSRTIVCRIADPGSGFRFERLAHSSLRNAPDKPSEHIRIREALGLRPGGYGMALVRALVDELIYNEAGNEVMFVKRLD